VKGRALKLQFRAWSVALGCIALLASCAHKDLARKNYTNVADDYSQRSGIEYFRTRASAEAYMLESVGLSEADRDYRPFVGVAISGGGSRAANFGLYVLEELDRLGMLNRVDAISSVSGGSIAAAHFGLYYPQLKDAYWPRAEEDLRQDLRDDWLRRHANPSNWRTLYQSDFNASTILAETYDEKLFHGATFKDLGPPGPGRPHILINATAIRNPRDFSSDCIAQGQNAYANDLGTFVFTTHAFMNCLGSRLSPYSVAQAVAASSAYPGLFSPVLLQTYPRMIDGPQRRKEYLHLIDGGVADNLGVDALVGAANQRRLDGLRSDDLHGTRRVADDQVPCFLIVVDAYIDGGDKLENEYPDLRHNLLDRAIDPSWKYAFDSLLQRRRYDTLLGLGIDAKHGENGQDYARSTASHTIALRREQGTTQMHIGDVVFLVPNTSDLTCAVWHISLRDVYELGADESRVLSDGDAKLRRASIYAMVTNADTDLKLTGGSACSPTQYQAALSDAAKILVREDAASLTVLHDWLAAHDVAPSGIWRPDAYGTNGRRFMVTAASKGPLGTASGRIRCLNSEVPKESTSTN